MTPREQALIKVLRKLRETYSEETVHVSIYRGSRDYAKILGAVARTLEDAEEFKAGFVHVWTARVYDDPYLRDSSYSNLIDSINQVYSAPAAGEPWE